MREAVIVPRGSDEVVVTLDALEGYASRCLRPEEACGLVRDQPNVFRRAANASPVDDGVVTLTRSILLERSWTVETYADQ